MWLAIVPGMREISGGTTRTKAMTVAIAGFIAAVYLAGVLDDYAGWTFLGGFAALADHFELFGYVIIGIFVATWLVAAAGWRFVKQGIDMAEVEA